MKVANISWWACYVILAVTLQASVGNIDFFLPGFIVALQERKIKQLAWVSFLFILLQEGMGTLPFGPVLVWYVVIMLLYYAWRWLFEVDSFIFIFLLSVVLSITHYIVILTFAGLQDMYIDAQRLFDKNMYQVFVTPLLWQVARYTRRGFLSAAEA